MHPDLPTPVVGPCIHTLRARVERLRAIATAGAQRLSAALFNAREACYQAQMTNPPTSADRVAALASAAALAEAELLGYRAAVADLLGALSTEVGA